MTMNKKADANMWWIIIGAVIALVVLIVLMVIFTTKTGRLGEGLSDCEGKSGVCVSTSTDACPSGTLSTSAFDCKSGEKCCLGSPKPFTGVTEGCTESVTASGKQWCK